MIIYDDKNKIYNYSQLDNETKIRLLKEIKNILGSEEVLDDEYISCSDLLEIVEKERSKYYECKHQFDELMSNIMRQKFPDGDDVSVTDFDYDKKELIVSCKNHITKHNAGDEGDEIRFTKNNGDLSITSSSTSLLHSACVLDLFGNYLSMLYDSLMSFAEFKSNNFNCIKPINSNFSVSISHRGVSIVDGDMLSGVLEINAKNEWNSNEYSSICNSNEIMNALRGREEEIFKRVKVKISDCPIWCQQLIEEEKNAKIEEERIRTEAENKQNRKRKELIKKIFPFMKK